MGFGFERLVFAAERLMSILEKLTVTPLLYACGGLLLAGLTAFGIQTYRLHGVQSEVVKLQRDIAQERLKAATDLLLFNAASRAKEQSMRDGFHKTITEYRKESADAQANADRVAADLRAGNIRLRREWLACTSAASVPGTAEPAAGADAGADDRAGLAAAVVRSGAECAIQVRGLQRLLRAERENAGQ